MRLGIYIGDFQEEKSGGAATFQGSIVEALLRIETKHEVYFFYDGPKKDFAENKNIHFINIHFKKCRFFQDKTKYRDKFFNKKILEYKIELLWFLIPSFYRVEVPYVFTVWDLAHRVQPYFPELSLSGWTFDQREKFYQAVIPKAARVITGNVCGAQEIEKFYNFPRELIREIPFSTPSFVFSGEYDDEILAQNNLQKNSYIFYPAQFWPHKNHIRIVKALALLKNKNINLKVVFVGADKGNKEYIKEKVAQYGLENEVRFLGFVSRGQLIALYKNAFALAYASMVGPNNLPPLEAMALDCPVLCADIAGMKEQLQEAAIFFKALSESDLAQKIESLYSGTIDRNDLIKKGRELALSLTSDKYVEKILQIVDEFSAIRECWSGDKKYIHL